MDGPEQRAGEGETIFLGLNFLQCERAYESSVGKEVQLRERCESFGRGWLSLSCCMTIKANCVILKE